MDEEQLLALKPELDLFLDRFAELFGREQNRTHARRFVQGLLHKGQRRNVENLAEAIDAGFSGRQDLDEALGAYQERRDAETIQIYRINDLFASRQVSPEMAMALFQGMADQAQAAQQAASAAS